MKHVNYYFLGLMFLMFIATACHEDMDQPPLVLPTSSHVPNMSLAEFKAKHWKSSVNYVDTVTEDEVIHGWVTSSDETGNIYRFLYITDESGAGMPIAVKNSSLFSTYRFGQELVIPMKGHYVGKKTGQIAIGVPSFYNTTIQTDMMPSDEWDAMVEPVGMPDPSKVDTVVISIADLADKTDDDVLREYQGKLVRLRGVAFSGANGVLPFAEPRANTNRYVYDQNGDSLCVRNSGYCDFTSEPLPVGMIDLVGLMGFYATRDNASGTWQLFLRDLGDVLPSSIKPVMIADFGTMGDKSTRLGTYTSESGWVATNCFLLVGGKTKSNPTFPFIGYALQQPGVFAKAPTLNGGTDKTGTLVSPVLHDGLLRLRFSYGYAYSGKKLAFRVDVKQNGNVVKTWTITDDDVVTEQAYSFDEECQVAGDFTIEFTNLCPSQATGNKDRLSIWNVNWDNMD
jgi:hypothetical protein